MLVSIRKWAMSPWIIVPMLLLVLSLSLGGLAASSSGTKGRKVLSGSELYMGIVFGQGEIAKQLPYIKEYVSEQMNRSSAELLAQEKFYKEMAGEIDRTFPGYFNQFSKDVYSKDYYAIKKAVEEGANKFLAAGLCSEKFGEYFSKSSGIAQKTIARFDTKTTAGMAALEQHLAANTNWSNARQIEELRSEAGKCVVLPICIVLPFPPVLYLGPIYVAAVNVEQEEQEKQQEETSSPGTLTIGKPVLSGLQTEKLVTEIVRL